ncbi:MAG TPA: NADH-quinone oxidoreductase subunit J, partial [Xanthomonadales bacterium]|nr:NADH-quinone oxidoreductase subunit J [Xanthomonadales bacterium]
INTAPLREGFARYLPVAALVAIVMAVEMVVLLGSQRFGQVFDSPDPAGAIGNTAWLGQALFTDFVIPFELAAVILTVAIVIAIALTLRRRPGTKHQDPALQVQVRREDRVRLVKMKAESTKEASE